MNKHRVSFSYFSQEDLLQAARVSQDGRSRSNGPRLEPDARRRQFSGDQARAAQYAIPEIEFLPAGFPARSERKIPRQDLVEPVHLVGNEVGHLVFDPRAGNA